MHRFVKNSLLIATKNIYKRETVRQSKSALILFYQGLRQFSNSGINYNSIKMDLFPIIQLRWIV